MNRFNIWGILGQCIQIVFPADHCDKRNKSDKRQYWEYWVLKCIEDCIEDCIETVQRHWHKALVKRGTNGQTTSPTLPGLCNFRAKICRSAGDKFQVLRLLQGSTGTGWNSLNSYQCKPFVSFCFCWYEGFVYSAAICRDLGTAPCLQPITCLI